MAFMATKSKTPSKVSSAPMGSCMTRGVAPSISSIISLVLKKLAPILSILFTKQIRGTLYLYTQITINDIILQCKVQFKNRPLKNEVPLQNDCVLCTGGTKQFLCWYKHDIIRGLSEHCFIVMKFILPKVLFHWDLWKSHLSACLHTVSDCGSTPETASNKTITPSKTLKARSTYTTPTPSYVILLYISLFLCMCQTNFLTGLCLGNFLY